MSLISAVSAARVNADLLAASSAPTESSHGKQKLVEIDDCGTVPHKVPVPPPPPPVLSLLEHFGASPLQQGRVQLDNDWCGTLPRNFPSPPPPPSAEPPTETVSFVYHRITW
jgi:hypothetical protein